MGGVFSFVFFAGGTEGRGKGIWLKKMRVRQEVRKWTIGWKEEEEPAMMKRPADLSLTPPPVSDSASLSLCLSAGVEGGRVQWATQQPRRLPWLLGAPLRDAG